VIQARALTALLALIALGAALVDVPAFGAAAGSPASPIQEPDAWARSLGTSAHDAAGRADSGSVTITEIPEGADPDYPGATGPVAPWDRTFALSSDPGSSHTLYLDFVGRTVSDSHWNRTYGADTITAEPFSLDTDTAHFSRLELTAIQSAWATVAEDYAPFDINVTTVPTPTASLARTPTADTRWGTEVLIANRPQQFAGCGCGGDAYLGDPGQWAADAGLGLRLAVRPQP